MAEVESGATIRVAELWRYPVKSLLGERLPRLEFAQDGVDGDRLWGILDQGDGRILTARREPRLLLAAARLGAGGAPSISLPDGRVLEGLGPASDAALSDWLGKPVTLVCATALDASRAEYFADAIDDGSRAIEWVMPAGRFVDAYPVLVLTTAALRACVAAYPAGTWDTRRFRPNVVVELDGEGWPEDAWADRRLRVGTAELIPRRRCIRCTMVSRGQPGLDRDVNIYKALSRIHGGDAGMWTEVARPGALSVGDGIVVD